MSAGEARGVARPARAPLARALLATYSCRVLGAALLALPVVQAVSASGVTRFPEGDGKLFEGGGLFLLEVLMREREAFGAAVPATVLLALLVSLAAIVPEWLVVRALGPSAARARSALTSCFWIGIATWGARVVLGLGTLLVALTVRSYVAGMRDERAPFFALAAAALLGLGAQACISVVHDGAVVLAIVQNSGATDAIGSALARLRRRWSRWLVRYALFTLVGLCAALGCAVGVSVLDVASSGAWLTAMALHQLTIGLGIGLRAAWLWTLRRELPPPQADAFL
jgi:hypothetical protein